MSKPWIVMTVVLSLAIGASAGVGATLLWGDDDDASTAAASVDCEEAQAAVDAANTRITEIDQAETRDPGYYAALIVEQRTVVFVMDTGPGCFTLGERAAATGLLEGIHALLDTLAAGSAAAQAGSAGAPPETSSAEE